MSKQAVENINNVTEALDLWVMRMTQGKESGPFPDVMTIIGWNDVELAISHKRCLQRNCFHVTTLLQNYALLRHTMPDDAAKKAYFAPMRVAS